MCHGIRGSFVNDVVTGATTTRPFVAQSLDPARYGSQSAPRLAWLRPAAGLACPAVGEGDLDDDDERALSELYDSLVHDLPETCAVAHLAQSLDGRIATARGGSKWLSGSLGLRHAHRMRALFDAVVVGIETARLDDPELTVRLVAGPNPVRVIVDPSLSLPASSRVASDGAARTLVVASASRVRGRTRVGDAEVLPIPEDARGILDPRAIVTALAERGLRRVYVEGGGVTVSRFLEAGCLERLYLTVAPLLLGSGRPSLALPEIAEVSEAMRPRTRQLRLGEDTLVECVLGGA